MNSCLTYCAIGAHTVEMSDWEITGWYQLILWLYWYFIFSFLAFKSVECQWNELNKWKPNVDTYECTSVGDGVSSSLSIWIRRVFKNASICGCWLFWCCTNFEYCFFLFQADRCINSSLWMVFFLLFFLSCLFFWCRSIAHDHEPLNICVSFESEDVN